MRRRGDARGVTVEGVPGWVLRFDPDRYRDVEPGPQLLHGEQWGPGMLWTLAAHAAHRQESRAWRADHAPHLSWRELDAERRRRFPVVDPVAR